VNKKKGLLIGAGLFLFLLLLLFFSSKGKPVPARQHQASTLNEQGLASGDTNNEVMQELIAKFKAQQEEQKKVLAESKQSFETQQADLKNQAQTLKDTLQTTLSQAKKNQQKQIAELKSQIENMQTTRASNTYPIQTDSASSTSGEKPITVVQDISVHIDPRTGKPDLNSPSTTKAGRVKPLLNSDDTVKSQAKAKAKPIPYYTIPALSTLSHTALLTALVGEVAVGNSLVQPLFPFTALIGRKDLMAANGIHLPPGLSGMKISGYSVGVGTFVGHISCVRAYITQVLFVFKDGHFATYGKSQGAVTSVQSDSSLGYLSDAHGNPCIPGKYITDAKQILAIKTVSGGLSGAGAGLASAQTNTLTGFDGATTTLNGDVGKYAAGYALNSAFSSTEQYINQRIKDAFDIVFIPASQNGKPTQLVANFTQTIPIDYNPEGRRLNDAAQLSSNQVNHLD